MAHLKSDTEWTSPYPYVENILFFTNFGVTLEQRQHANTIITDHKCL